MLRLRPEHLSDLHTHPGAGGVDDAQRTSPQGRWSFLLHLLHGQCLNKHLCSREVTGAQEVGNSTDSEGQWFCSSSSPRASSVVLWIVSDATCFGLMVRSSGSMVLLLHGHHQSAAHSHPRRPPADQSRPRHPDAGGHLCHFAEFHCCFLCHCLFRFLSGSIQTSSILALCCPFLLILRNPEAPRSRS